MSVWDMKELESLAKIPVMCPTCVAGPMVRGYNREYKPVIARVIADRKYEDAQGVIQMTVFQRVIICKVHGQRLVEIQM